MKGTWPVAETTQDFKDACCSPSIPSLIDDSYVPESYDVVAITALAAAIAGTDDPGMIATEIDGVTRDGEKCTTYADCIALIDAGTDIDYDGPSGPQTFGPEGEPTEASFQILSYDEENKVDGTIPPVYKFAKI